MQPFSRPSRNARVAKTKGRQKSAMTRGDMMSFILKAVENAIDREVSGDKTKEPGRFGDKFYLGVFLFEQLALNSCLWIEYSHFERHGHTSYTCPLLLGDWRILQPVSHLYDSLLQSLTS